MSLSNLLIGMIYDEREQRDYAVMQYQKVLDMKDYEGSHLEAKKYMEKPFIPNKMKIHIIILALIASIAVVLGGALVASKKNWPTRSQETLLSLGRGFHPRSCFSETHSCKHSGSR